VSSLIFYTDPNQVMITTDTLAVFPDGAPCKLTSKVFAIPHLKMLMCGTGASGFLGRWFIEVNDQLVIQGIDHLDYHTSQNLTKLWELYKEEFPISETLTTTVYHFGISESEGLLHAYVYRSSNGFKSEAISFGIGVKPVCDVPDDAQFPLDIPKMMEQQREIQSSLLPNERVYIGGEMIVHHLTQNGISIYSIGDFEDREETERAIYRNFTRSE
jgi:hypothetical protein